MGGMYIIYNNIIIYVTMLPKNTKPNDFNNLARNKNGNIEGNT